MSQLTLQVVTFKETNMFACLSHNEQEIALKAKYIHAFHENLLVLKMSSNSFPYFLDHKLLVNLYIFSNIRGLSHVNGCVH